MLELSQLAAANPLPVLLHVAKFEGPERCEHDGQSWKEYHGPYYRESERIIGVYLPADNAEEWKQARRRYDLIKDQLWPGNGLQKLVDSALTNKLKNVRSFVVGSRNITNSLNAHLGFDCPQEPEQVWIQFRCVFHSMIELDSIQRQDPPESVTRDTNTLDRGTIEAIESQFEKDKSLDELSKKIGLTKSLLLSQEAVVEFIRSEVKANKTQEDIAKTLCVDRSLVGDVAKAKGIKFDRLRGKNFANFGKSRSKSRTRKT